MPSLSDVMKSPDVGRPEREYPICVAGKLVRELEQVDAQLFEVESKLDALRADAQERREGIGPVRRMNEKSEIPTLEAEADALAEQADAIRERMEQNTITLQLRGRTNGEWRQWVSKHPARDEDDDKAGYLRDQRNAAGFCNIDALINDLGDYVTKYGDDDPSDASWRFILDNAAPGNLTRLASTVVGMHEQVVSPGKARTGWLATRRSANVSE